MKTMAKTNTEKLRTLSLALILILQIVLPLQMEASRALEENNLAPTSSRDVEPDVNITNIQWLGPSYFDLGFGTDILAPSFPHETQITLANDGLATAPSVTLQIDIDSNDGSGWQFLHMTIIQDITPGEVVNYIFSWSPTLNHG